MKKLNEILSHLKKNPEFRKINTSTSIKKFIEVLPLKLKKGVKFAYIRTQTLYFVLTHPVYKMEFEYNKADIKSLLKMGNFDNVTEIAFFVSNKIEKKEKIKKEEPLFKERAKGSFYNQAKDGKIYEKFENIREIIRGS
ncbi:DUF721 domain-containing protein [Poseidonibacter antarcticus]|uniref:DUF721 domain-containing protein n=1 Tax=Poseidonibacter antarcticus TaxID=2478538 RepID=UPI000EF54A76|nr:DUF721 domain-containing protein [Poseidonibacter antarcticus]